MTFPRPCVRCGIRIPSGSYCPKCKPAPLPERTEAQRLKSQPHRKNYARGEYLRNRKARYELVGGVCEVSGCGAELKGHLFPLGVPWEAHHNVALIDGGDNSVSNLRCLCDECHHRITAITRRNRKEAKQ
ncbi:MAG: HNH endonuclease [Coriobacteriia bacterium]|nr:HNH endonuclease [Coriobacteriia bacterium]